MTKRAYRIAVGASLLLIVVPTMLLALLGLFTTAMTIAESGPAGVLPMLQMIIVLAALTATAYASTRILRRGDAAPTALPSRTLAAMHAGAVLVVFGLLAIFVDGVFPLGYVGKFLSANVLGLPMLLPYLLLLGLHRDRRSSVRPAMLGFGIVLAFVAASLVLLGPRPFDRELWHALASERDDTWVRRQRMAAWLEATSSLVGDSRADVIATLGEPTDDRWFGGNGFAYPLGAGIGFFLPEIYWLQIDFDEDDRVVDVRVVAID